MMSSFVVSMRCKSARLFHSFSSDGESANVRSVRAVIAAAATVLFGITSGLALGNTFSYTGGVQTWVVPANVGQVTIEAWGGQGGANARGISGGLGGYAKGDLVVTPGETLYIFVGGGGLTSTSGFFNGGGNAGTGATTANSLGGGGGGASDVRRGGSALSNRVIVAGGGGGAGGNRVATEGRGGGGGGGGGYYGGGGGAAWPQNSPSPTPTGGTQMAGGVGGTSSYTTAAPGNNGLDGALGVGGNGGAELPSNQAGSLDGAVGGVGGGLTGGDGIYAGGFTGSSGAGGSSYVGGVTNSSTAQGLRSGHGAVIITVSQTLTPQTLTFGPAPTVIVNGSGNVNATSATPNSGNPIIYSTASTDCSVTSAGVVTGINAGTNNCTILATQAGDATYAGGTATLTFNIGQASQILTFATQTPSSRSFVANSTFSIVPQATASTPNSGNAIAYGSLTGSICTVSGTTVTMLAVGDCVIAANLPGNSNFAAAEQVSQSVRLLANVTVGGTVSGLVGTGLVLSLNGGAQTLPVSANGAFAFGSAVVEGSSYSVTVQTQPSSPSQTCTVSNGSGTVSTVSVTNIAVNCVTNLANVTVGGTVSGLVGAGLVISLNGGSQSLPVSANGAFTFPNSIIEGSAYSVTVQTQPSGPLQTCSVTNGSGNAGNSNVTNILVTCVTNQALVTIALPSGVIASPSGNQNVVIGSTLTISLTVPPGFALRSVTGCGGSLVGSVYTTAPIASDCTVTVSLEALSSPALAVPSVSRAALLLLMACLAVVAWSRLMGRRSR